MIQQIKTGYLVALILLFSPLAAQPLWAGQTLDVYSAKALVKNQSESERNRAARATLGEVVVRVSGQASALANPEVQQAADSAQNFLYGFSYNATSEQIQEGDKSFPAMEVQLNYSQEAIQQLLREAHLPLWPAQRPKVLVWLVVEDANGVRVDTAPEHLDSLRKAAAYRGLPLVVPTVDAALGAPANKLWQFNLAEIERVSQTYRADAVLIGRYHPVAQGEPIPLANYSPQDEVGDTALAADSAVESSSSSSSLTADATLINLEPQEPQEPQGPWEVDWQLLRADDHQGWGGQVEQLAAEYKAQVDRLADIFATEYAIIPSDHGPQTITVHLGGISDFTSFKRAQAYLAGLAMVKQMEVVKVEASGLLLKLTIEGDIKLLISTLALGKKLQPENAQALIAILNRGSVSPMTTGAGEMDEAALAAELDRAIAKEAGLEQSDTPGLPIVSEASSCSSADVNVESQSSTSASTSTSGAGAVSGPGVGTDENPLAYLWKP